MQPMLTAEHLTRRYGRRTVLRDVSFTADKGEIVALLGRNGAGKSTLMNILTGYLSMTDGRATAAGFDVQQDALHARRAVGYLPETPPLYPDMTVSEYLRYCAELKGIPARERRAEVERVIERTALTSYAGRLAGRLSKGYRQRLGLAQALLGSPKVLILDEPGSGLDPVQMQQMREVIRTAGEECTVLLSSHILSEVTNVCTRALVLDEGILRYDGPMSALLENRGTVVLISRGGENLAQALGGLRGVTSVRSLETEECCDRREVRFDPAEDLRGDILRCAAACGADVLELYTCRCTLEDAFLRLTEKEGRA